MSCCPAREIGFFDLGEKVLRVGSAQGGREPAMVENLDLAALSGAVRKPEVVFQATRPVGTPGWRWRSSCRPGLSRWRSCSRRPGASRRTPGHAMPTRP